MSRPLGVTGSTGRLGGRVARRLEQAGVPQRLLVRDPARAPQLRESTVHRGDYGDGAAVTAALEGVDTVFMVSAAESPDRLDQHRTFLDAAQRAGVRHVVYTSFFGAAPDATFTLARDHWATEEHLRTSGMTWTFLRDNLYLDFLPGMAGADDVLRGPAAQGRVTAVAQDDVADVAATVLLDPGSHAAATYDLTGPQALTLTQVAAIITEFTTRGVQYVPETVQQAYDSRGGHGVPQWQLDAWVSTYTAIGAGELDGVTHAVPTLTGHPATSLADLLRHT